MKIRSYSELRAYSSFEDRYEYLKLNGEVAAETFGFDRYLNQRFYTSQAWKRARDEVILRDNACDLGVEGYDIRGRLTIHHMNPIRPEDLVEFNPDILDPEFLISVTHNTHNAIHYGDANLLVKAPIERSPGDHLPW